MDKHVDKDFLSYFRVLLVEDNPGDARLVQEMLDDMDASWRFDLTWKHSLGDGLNSLKNNQYHAVLLDLSLPDSQGIDTLKTFHQYAPNKPIVVLTGRDDAILATAALQNGADHYLVKGKTKANLIAVSLYHALSRSKSQIKYYKRFIGR